MAFALACAACAPEFSLPPGSRLRCQTSADCPEGRVCREGLCADPADSTPPDLAQAPSVTPSPASAGKVSVALKVTEALSEPPRVTLALRPPVLLPCEAAGELAYTCAYTVPEDPARRQEGTFAFDVSLVDRALNRTERLQAGFVSLDFTPPSVLAQPVTPPRARVGSTLQVFFELTEPVVGPVVLRTSPALAGEPDPLVLVAEAGTRSYRFSHVVTPDDPAGPVQLGVSPADSPLRDAAGNAVPPVSLGTVVIDNLVPQVVGPVTVTPARARRGALVSVALTVNKPLVQSRLTLGGVEMERDAASTATSLRYSLPADGEEGLHAVVLDAVDETGNALVAGLGAVTFDFTAPTVLSSAVAPPVARSGAVALLTVAVSEPVVAPPTLHLAGPAPLPSATLQSEQDLVYVFALDTDGTGGAFALTADLEDEAGNPSLAQGLPGLSVDAVPLLLGNLKASPEFASEGATVTVSFDLSKDVGQEPPGLSVTLGGVPIGCAPYQAVSPNYTCATEADGAEGPVQVAVQALDAAGNAAAGGTSITYDFTPPSLAASGVFPAVARAGETVTLSLAADEPLGVAPYLEATETTTGDSLEFTVQPGTTWAFQSFIETASPQGRFQAWAQLTDRAGNTARADLPLSFVVDHDAPAITALAAQPRFVRADGSVSADFRLSEPAPQLAVTLGGRAMQCACADTGTPKEQSCHCTYALAGDEIAAGTEALQTVVVDATDEAGNRSFAATPAGGSVLFDFKPPGVASATIDYQPAATNPLRKVTAATKGTRIEVTVTFDEPVDPAAPPALTATVGTSTLAFGPPFALTATQARFATTPTTSWPYAVYDTSLSMTDRAGNRSTGRNVGKITLKTDRSTLSVDTAALVYSRVPSSTVDVASATAPLSKPRFALVSAAGFPTPADPSTFGLDFGEAVMVRFWTNAAASGFLLGTLQPDAGGNWPLGTLASVDSPSVYATAVDEAGNETAAVKIPNAEWVATPIPPEFGPGPHPVDTLTSVEASVFPAPGTAKRVALAANQPTPAAAALQASAEGLWRQRLLDAVSPLPRAFPSVAYDSLRGRTVMFGGIYDYDADETWEWDGTNWSDVSPAGPHPEGRHYAAMAYDSVRGRVVLFGGRNSSPYPPYTGNLPDTWEWDGTAWRDRTDLSAPHPSARWGHAMAFDPVRGKVVLFGGYAWGTPSFVSSNETWEWDGAGWTKRAPAASPSARYWHTLTWSPTLKKCLLFGGGSSASGANDLWSWDGTNWTQLAATTPVPARARHAAAFDPVRNTLVVFGGRSNTNTELGDVWEWNGTAWSSAATGPSAREGAGMAYDLRHSRMLVVDGGETPTAQVWARTGTSWLELTSNGLRPSPRYGAMAAYDSQRKKAVLFGGIAPSGAKLGDTWEWDGANWRPSTAAAPAARAHAAGAYLGTGRVVMFGGEDAAGTVLGENWEWNGTAWTSRAAGPAPRTRAAMTNVGAGKVLLFGGNNGTAPLQDPYEWNGTAWTSRPVTTIPEAREGHAMVYDPVRARTILGFGQRNSAFWDNSYEWDGTTWSGPPAYPRPERRFGAGLVFVPERGVPVLTTGFYQFNPTQDVFEWTGTAWRDRTPSGLLPPGRNYAAVLYDEVRRSVLVFGGSDSYLPGSCRGDQWEFDPRPVRTPAVQVWATTPGDFDRASVAGLRVRARCGGTYAAATGAALWGWSTAAGLGGAWVKLKANTSGIPIAAAPGGLIDWTAATADEARQYLVEGERLLAFQCRPAGTSTLAQPEPSVALDYLEVRVRYLAPDR